VGAVLVDPNDEIMLITDKGVLVRTRVAEVREMGRATQGVTLIAVDDGSQLAGLQRILESDVGEDGSEASEEAEAADDAQGQDSPDTTVQ